MYESDDPVDLETHAEFHVFRDFMFHFIPLVFVAIVAVALGLGTQKHLRTERIKVRERNLIEQEIRVIQTDLAAHVSDALLVAEALRTGFFLCTDETLRSTLFQHFLTTMSRVRKVYDQIRFLDDTGREIIRVNRKKGGVYLVDDQELQDKSSRPYYIQAMHAPESTVVVSRFDLNIEHGQVERPVKPVIRFSTPVDDASGNRLGVVVLNYLGSRLLEMIMENAGSGDGAIHLANLDGYWLIGPTPEEEWGFMQESGDKGHIARRFPELWEYMGEHEDGQVVLGSELFTFTTMSPLPVHPDSASSSADSIKPERWVLISRVSMDFMGREYLMVGVPLALVAFVGLGLVALMWTLARQREHRATGRLVNMATRDGLTNLYNRKYFVQCVDREIERAKRYDHPLSLVLFDIDHFKRINDTHGHVQGDEVLRTLATLVRESCRDQDVAGRVGGEEFAVLLPETGREQAAVMAERLRQAVEDLEVRVAGGEVIRFTISIGVISSDPAVEDMDFQTLFTKVDALMYQAKEGGRNRVVVG
jgi:diguanylate cyclase (GGDEF)-like protein